MPTKKELKHKKHKKQKARKKLKVSRHHYRDVRDEAKKKLATKDVQTHPAKKEFWEKKRAKANRRLDRLPRRIANLSFHIENLAEKIRNKARLKPDFNGRPTNVTKAVRAHILRGNRAGLVVSATSNGVHATGSWHYQVPCAAADMYGIYTNMVNFQRKEAARGYYKYNELFGPDGFYIKNGVRYSGHFPNHGNHTHGAPRS